MLGLANAQRWLDDGSLALQAHLVAAPGLLQVPDFSLAAGALQLGGQLEADFAGVLPFISGRIDAPRLNLPRIGARSAELLPFAWLGGWQAVLALRSAETQWGADVIARDVTAELAASGGVVAAAVSQARVGGGAFVGDAVADASAAAPAVRARFALEDAALDSLPGLPPLELHGGEVGLTGELAASGNSPAALLATLGGEAEATLRDVALAGVDLPRLRQLLAAKAPRQRAGLLAAMSAGDTGPLAGTARASLRDGALRLSDAALAGAAGGVAVSGGVDMPARSADVGVRVTPDVANAPALGLRLSGPWQAVKRTVDVRQRGKR
jgi:uncharacterized protein involved in outer membrane biogenesis